MANVGKIIGITTIVGVAGIFTYKLVSKARDVSSLINNIRFNITPSKAKISGTNLSVFVNVEIINPTKLSVSFEKPYVRIFYNGNLLAESKQSKDLVKVEPQGTTKIKDIELKISLLSNISTFVDMGKKAFTDLKITESTSATNKALAIASKIATNAQSILPLLSVWVKTYVGGQPIEYSTALATA